MTPVKRQRTSSTEIPADILLASDCLDTVGKITLAMATSPTTTRIVIDALAGSGKTYVLMRLMDILKDHSQVLLLSFTRAAVRVARARSGMRLTAQTFDGFFHHLVQRSPEYIGQELEILETRRVAMELGIHNDHKCAFGSDQWYRLDTIRYVLVDEAQDTPPEAVELLDRLSAMGKRIIITGDPHQTIFTFLDTVSLFKKNNRNITIPMHTTRRCCPEVVDAVNSLFKLTMTSNCFWKTFEGTSLVFQARTNHALGVVYAKILFTLPWKTVVMNDENEDFHNAVRRTVRRMYRFDSDDDADSAIKRRLSEKPRFAAPTLYFSTIHGFKGSEADVTVLCEDVDVTCPDVDYKLRYVAMTRARFGVMDLASLSFWGNNNAKTLLHDVVYATCRETVPKNVFTSTISNHPVGLIRLALENTVPPRPATFIRHRNLAFTEATGVLTSWALTRKLQQSGVRVAETDAVSGFLPTHDYRYKRLYDRNILSREQHRDVCSVLTRIRLRALCVKAMVIAGTLRPTTRLAARGAYDYTRLRRFKAFSRLETIRQSVHPPPLTPFDVAHPPNLAVAAFGVQIKTEEGWRGFVDMVWREVGSENIVTLDYVGGSSRHMARQYLNGLLMSDVTRSIAGDNEIAFHEKHPPPFSLGAFGYYRRFYGARRDIFDEIA